jgi:hypothetical protein
MGREILGVERSSRMQGKIATSLENGGKRRKMARSAWVQTLLSSSFVPEALSVDAGTVTPPKI